MVNGMRREELRRECKRRHLVTRGLVPALKAQLIWIQNQTEDSGNPANVEEATRGVEEDAGSGSLVIGNSTRRSVEEEIMRRNEEDAGMETDEEIAETNLRTTKVKPWKSMEVKIRKKPELSTAQ